MLLDGLKFFLKILKTSRQWGNKINTRFSAVRFTTNGYLGVPTRNRRWYPVVGNKY